MTTKPTVRDLATVLATRRQNKDDEQFALLLGRACARAAGNPYEKVTLKLGSTLSSHPSLTSLPGLSDFASTFLSNVSTGDVEQAMTKIPERIRPAASRTLNRLLVQYYANLPVPLFYQDLGSIVKGGYFSRVLTTNYDNLLEQALESPPIPWRRDRDYHVIDVPAFTRDGLKEHLQSVDKRSLLILKMHGDLLQEGAALDFTEIQAALVDHRKTLYQELSDDLLVVGYEQESPGIDKALHAQSGGAIWWISEKTIDAEFKSGLEAVRPVTVIDGPEANPESLFGTLCTVLSRPPEAVSSPSESVQAQPDEGLKIEVLRDRLVRAQNELERLRQSSPPGANPDIDAQIDYQRQQISDIEDQIRVQEKDKIVLLVGDLLTRAKNNSVDPSTLGFLEQQATQVMSQFSTGQPNQHVVSAAITALSVLGRRLGENIAPASTMRELNSYSPSTFGRGI
jgi:hypothetical protein